MTLECLTKWSIFPYSKLTNCQSTEIAKADHVELPQIAFEQLMISSLFKIRNEMPWLKNLRTHPRLWNLCKS